MVRTSVLNDALNAINNAEKSGKRQVRIYQVGRHRNKHRSIFLSLRKAQSGSHLQWYPKLKHRDMKG
jgi:hypothetical protein